MEKGDTFFDMDNEELWVAIKVEQRWNGEWVLAEVAVGDIRLWFAPWETNHVAAQ